ncbi:MAG: hypothetical protein OXU81_11400, partial [Gammaproteobacteria bacterium]|nr:hypothetical protein [Gammaproteobacteria bacterium]
HEERLEALRDRRTDLEVERIVAGAASRTSRIDSDLEVAGADAAAIVEALDRLRRLDSRNSAHLALAGAGVRSHDELLERLRAGDDALGAWLEAGREDTAASSARRIARQALFAVCLVVLALAFTIHLAFLVLLVPVGGAMSFLLWTGQDRAWQRVGARRRFERLGLETPATWTEAAVRERRSALARIAERIRERASTADSENPPSEEERVHGELDAARADLQDALTAAGLDEERLDDPAEAALRAIARVYRAEQALQGVVEEMAGERDGAGTIRESLYRSLAREGEAARDGDASADALGAGIERSRRR